MHKGWRYLLNRERVSITMRRDKQNSINATMLLFHYNDVIMSTMASQITSLTIVYSTFYSGGDQRKHQSSASLAFVRGIHRGPVNSPYKWPVTRKMFPFDDVIMLVNHLAVWLIYIDPAFGQLYCNFKTYCSNDRPSKLYTASIIPFI